MAALELFVPQNCLIGTHPVESIKAIATLPPFGIKLLNADPVVPYRRN
jgi:hypothetical protein